MMSDERSGLMSLSPQKRLTPVSCSYQYAQGDRSLVHIKGTDEGCLSRQPFSVHVTVLRTFGLLLVERLKGVGANG